MSLLSFEVLHRVFERYDRIVLAYLFGSLARGQETGLSDVDIAVLLEDLPTDLLGFTLKLMDELSVILGDRVDLVFLNEAPPLLRHQLIKHRLLIDETPPMPSQRASSWRILLLHLSEHPSSHLTV